MVEGFTKINNDCGLDTYIFKIPNCIIVTEPTPLRFNAEVYPGEKKWFLHTKLPSKLEFEKAEFGIIYAHSSDWRNPYYIERPEDWFDNYWHLIFQDISFRYPLALISKAFQLNHF